MNDNPIEEHWRQVVQESFADGFCCAAHRELFRELFFSGAMAAMQALTGWDPARSPNVLGVAAKAMVAVSDELTTAYHEMMAEDGPEAVRH